MKSPANRSKRLGASLLLLLLAACGQDASGAESGKPGEFIKPRSSPGIEVLNGTVGHPFYINLGTLIHGEPAAHTFTLRNTEDVPVTILRTVPACTCARVHSIVTKPEEGEPVQAKMNQRNDILTVAPGELFDVVVVVNTKELKDETEKNSIVTMATDSKVQPYVQFEIYFKSLRLFYQSKPQLNLGSIPVGGGVGATLQIWTRPVDHRARLIEIVETSEGLQADLESISGFEANWNLSVTAIGQIEKGPMRGHVILSHSDADGEGTEGRLKIPITGTVVDPVALYPLGLSFGDISAKLGKTLPASVQGLAAGHQIKVQKAEITGPSAPYLDITLEPVAPSSFGTALRVDIKLIAKPGIPEGPVDATLTVELADPSLPPISRKIRGTVQS